MKFFRITATALFLTPLPPLMGAIGVAIAMSGPAAGFSNRTFVAEMESQAMLCGRIGAGLEKIEPGSRNKLLSLVMMGSEIKLYSHAMKMHNDITEGEVEGYLSLIELAFAQGEQKPLPFRNNGDKKAKETLAKCLMYFEVAKGKTTSRSD